MTYESLESRQLLATVIADFSLSGTLDWTDGSSWIGGNVPGPNDRAVIPQNTTLQLDGTSHTVQELVVMGTLEVPEVAGVDRSLTSDWIHVNSGGVFQVGTEANRYDTADFTLTLTGTDPGQTFTVETATGNLTISDNDSFLMAAGGGRLQFFGQEKLSFTKLAATANANSNQIIVENVIERNFDGTTSAASDGSLDWQVGDQIVIASSSEDYGDEEVRTITAINDLGNGTSRLTLNSSLSNRHYGEIETYSNSTRTWDLDLRAEVALLSRNVKVTSEAWHDTDNNFGDRARFTQTLGNTGDGFGGHIMIMPTAGQIAVDGVQLDKLGQTSRLGRYPIHWHIAGDRTGDVLRQTSITNSNNRGVTIHGTHNVLVQDVVLHDIHGHGFFMEDGVETGNQYISNIAFGVHKVGRSAAVGNFAPDLNDPFIVDTHDHVGQNPNRFLSSAAYWVTNPDNTWIGNISAGSEGTGFWFIFPDSAIGLSASDPQYNNVRPDRTNLRQFDYNSAHSSPAGLNFDRGSDLEVPVGGNIKEFFDGDNWLPSEEPQINYFTGYKHNVAIYHRGFEANFHENRIADSDIGTFITFTQRITDTLYVGHSRGNADFSDSVTGHTIYDGANTLDGTHFAGFAANNAHTFRVNGSALRDTSHVMSNTSFENDGSAGHVSIANQGGGSSQNSPFDFSPAAIYDVDGTLTGHVGGGAGWTVVTEHPFFYDSDDIRPAGWNAAISEDLYAMLHLDPANSGSRFRVTAPDGDRIVDEGTSRRNTHIKVGYGLDPANDHLVELVAGSLSNAFDFKYRTRTGPSGPTVLRFVGFGNTLRPQNISVTTTLEELRASTESSYTVVNGDVYIKAFSSSTDIRMRSFSSSNPIAVNDQAATNHGESVTINVLGNDSDSDGDSLTVLPGTSVVVADYVDDFQSGTPTAGWQYLWNETGTFGSSNYSPLGVSGNGYRPAGETYPIIGLNYAHAGDGTTEDPQGIQRYAIAAFTVPEDGFYSIADSSVTMNANPFPVDGVNISAHVSGGPVSTLGVFGQGESGDFDGSLGFASAGQVIYIGVGANTHKGDDNTTLDFSIVRASTLADGRVTVNSDQSITFTPSEGFTGTTSFSYQVSDGRGGSDSATVTVNVVQPTVIPSIVSVVRDGGDESRPDIWSTLQIEFDTDVQIFSFSLQLFNDTDGGTSVSLAGTQFDYDSTNFVATWNFDNMDSPLREAYYTYSLSSIAVTTPDGATQMDGDGDGSAGGDLTSQVYVAIPGDADLDGDVDIIDSNGGDGFTFVQNLGTPSGATWADGDFDGDGDVDIIDSFPSVGDGFLFVQGIGKNVRPPQNAQTLSSPLVIVSQTVSATVAPVQSTSRPVPATTIVTKTDTAPFDEQETKSSKREVFPNPSTTLELSGNQERDNVFADFALRDSIDHGDPSDFDNAEALLVGDEV